MNLNYQVKCLNNNYDLILNMISIYFKKLSLGLQL